MTVKVVQQQTVYTIDEHPDFTTNCRHHAEAFDYVHRPEIVESIRQRLAQQARYTTPGRFDAAVERKIDDFVWFETKRRKATPEDHFGMDSKAGIDRGKVELIDGYTAEIKTA